MSLRWRLTAYYTGISVGLLLLGSLVLFLLLRTTLRQTLDGSLREAVALAASQLEHDKPRTAGTAELFLTRLPGATVLLVYSSQGVLIESYGVPPVRPAPVPGFRTVGSTRIYGEILADGSVIQAMRSEVEICARWIRSPAWRRRSPPQGAMASGFPRAPEKTKWPA